MLDPLILQLVSICLGLLFLLAAVHKLTALERFRATLAEYQLLPTAIVAPASLIVPLVEGILGAAWLLGIWSVSVAFASAALLGAYTGAIGINLLRGRVHIDCGCGMARSAGSDQQLSRGSI